MKQNWHELTRSYSVWDEKNIKGFFGEYRWLSNFYLCPVHFQGMSFPSSEHAYMSAKIKDPQERWRFFVQTNTLSCKKVRDLGQEVKLRPDWEELKYNFMFVVVWSKFSNNLVLAEKLRDTEGKYLEETNHWGDRYWGVCNGEGQNNLGKILMEVRKML